ncbi:hypothetical protein GCM10027269_82110 [Kribbella endophytica]
MDEGRGEREGQQRERAEQAEHAFAEVQVDADSREHGPNGGQRRAEAERDDESGRGDQW